MRHVESGSSRRRGGVSTLPLLVLVAACASGAPDQSQTLPSAGRAAEQPAAAAVQAQSAPSTLREISLREGAPGTEVDLSADGEIVWTSFRDPNGALVIELPNTVPAEALPAVTAEGLVASIDVAHEANGDRPLTRLTVLGREAFEYSLTSENQILRLKMLPTAPVEANAEIARVTPVEPLSTAAPMAPMTAAPARTTLAPGTTLAQTYNEPQAMGADEPAATPVSTSTASLLDVERVYQGSSPSGAVATRLDAVDNLGRDSYRLRGDGGFAYSYRRLANPERFVLDLEGVFDQADRVAAPAASGVVQRVRMAQFKPAPDPVTRVVFDLSAAATPRLESSTDGLVVSFGESPGERGEVVAQAPPARVAAPISASSPPPSQMPAPIAAAPVAPMAPMAPMAQRAQTAPPATIRASAPSVITASGPPMSDAVMGLRQRSFDGEQRVYYGDPITFSIRDGDVREVLRAIAEISNLNMVIQPGVTGSVTVELKSVPWDQALDQILRINNLGMELEGNILRIAPVEKLRAEAEEQQKFKAAQALSVPLKTVIKRLSYATAQETAAILQRRGGIGVGGNLMSQRGSVIVDTRTNTLIIKELPEYIDTVLAVIDNLDTPEPQVMIEARIVETSKQFSRSLGVAWAFDGVADARHGNTTGLVFPNNVATSGGANLLTGGRNGFLNLSLGNVLNTFTLDATLQAAENEGLINILSTPKIATLNNQSAEIQSGLQIPIQTVANNTVSVQFVNATLRLLVTPHVTAEGTVMMDINVQKREPLQAFLVVGAGNAPISTKEARTRVIVRDGGTTVIGGIYRVTQDKGEDRIPGLANIPLIGHLFKNRRNNNQNEELLIFITPRVIKL